MTTVQRQHYGTSLRNIIHPTDFSHGSDVAFAHALRLTLGCGGDLEILHVERGREKSNWERYPSVRQVLAQWGELPPHAARGDVARLGVNISKAVCTNSGTADGVLDHIHTRGAGLVVMATHQREGAGPLAARQSGGTRGDTHRGRDPVCAIWRGRFC